MTRTNSITLTLTPEQKAALQKLALEFEFLHGDRPNISALVGSIADGEIPLGKPSKAEKLRRKAELLAIKLKAVNEQIKSTKE